MIYKDVYARLIANARANPPIGYRELHHIVPRCLGGNDEPSNLIYLAARSHFVAHLLLAKIHGGRLVRVVFLMSKSSKYKSRHYAAFRQQYSEEMKGNKYGRFLRGHKRSAETRMRMSEAQKGHISHIKGRTFGPRKRRKTPEARAIASANMKALWEARRLSGYHQSAHKKERSAEYRQKLSERLRQQWKTRDRAISSEARRKISQNTRKALAERKARLHAEHLLPFQVSCR